MMTLMTQRKFAFNSLLEDIRGSKSCVIKVRQYITMGGGILPAMKFIVLEINSELCQTNIDLLSFEEKLKKNL